MPREKENFRYILEDLYSRYGYKATLTITELENIMNRSRQTIMSAAFRPKKGAEPLPLKKVNGTYTISTVALARWLA